MLYSFYRDGMLPEAGGLNQQPNKFLESVMHLRLVFDLCDRLDEEAASKGKGTTGTRVV